MLHLHSLGNWHQQDLHHDHTKGHVTAPHQLNKQAGLGKSKTVQDIWWGSWGKTFGKSKVAGFVKEDVTHVMPNTKKTASSVSWSSCNLPATCESNLMASYQRSRHRVSLTCHFQSLVACMTLPNRKSPNRVSMGEAQPDMRAPAPPWQHMWCHSHRDC